MNLPNYAGVENIDQALIDELEWAGITVEKLPEGVREHSGEVKTIIIGFLHGWVFERAWRYWICKGPGIPIKEATELHRKCGNEVRVDGNCTCPSPLLWFHGLGTGHYHVDTLRGLKELADTIKKVVDENLE